eukprot:1148696-Pelagomonas_calceolata.AAC.2
MEFQSILKVWEVYQIGSGGGSFRCNQSCLFPSQPSNTVEGAAAWASAKDTGTAQERALRSIKSKMGSLLTYQTKLLASGILLAKSWSQVGFWLFKWNFADGWARIGNSCRYFTVWNGPKFVAKVPVRSGEF